MRIPFKVRSWFIAGLVIGLSMSQIALVAAEPRRENVIVVLTDDQGYGDLSCHGNPKVRTPALDRWDRESVRFTNFHVSPTCAPTRAALLTGRHEFFSGVTHTIFERERLDLRARTLADELKQAGYATGIFGKWHLGDEDDYQPQRRGFQETFIHGGGGIGQTYPGSCGDAPGNQYDNPVVRHQGRFVPTQGYCTDVFFSAARTWIREAHHKGPFFAWIATNAPHAPFQPPPGYQPGSRPGLTEDQAKFYAMIENIDSNIQSLWEDLAQQGLLDRTHWIFLTDNGTATGAKVFNAGMRGAKGTPFEGGTRVPCFWRLPSRHGQPEPPRGVDFAGLTGHQDLAPTMLEVLSVNTSPAMAQQMRGRSFAAALEDVRTPWPQRTWITHVGRWPRGDAAKHAYVNAAIRDEQYALVFLPGGRQELHDLVQDPGQSNNLVERKPEVVKRLRTAYDEWWRSVQAHLVNEFASGPKRNPFHEAYWRQFQGLGPNRVPPPDEFPLNPPNVP